MPEMPEMQALAERLDALVAGSTLEAVRPLGFTGLKTVRPGPEDLAGRTVRAVGRRGKFLTVSLQADPGADEGPTVALHLSQAGRLDVERPPKTTKPRGSVVRFEFSGPLALLVREHGTQRKAGWWVLERGEDGPLATLGPEPDDPEFERLFLEGDSTRHVHTLLRDQHFVAGVGRGYADDALNRAGLSPFAALRSLSAAERRRLVESVRSVMAEALERERTRTGALSEARLGERFLVHNRVGEPCLHCGDTLRMVSFDSHEVVYCPTCQTKGKVLADRRLSRLLR